MKIIQPDNKIATSYRQIEELKFIISQLSDNSVRPCENCNEVCSLCGSSKCTCNCSNNCALSIEKLSSDAKLYPIESSIVPLVYCFNSMNICKTCWSCEGHNNSRGQLDKLPQLWFYTDSFMLLRIIDDCLSLLKAKSLLVVSWALSLTYTAKSCQQNTFVLKPDLSLVDKIDLKSLHKDIIVISENLPELLKKSSEDYLTILNKSLYAIQ